MRYHGNHNLNMESFSVAKLIDNYILEKNYVETHHRDGAPVVDPERLHRQQA
jgi:hypothetical protein